MSLMPNPASNNLKRPSRFIIIALTAIGCLTTLGADAASDYRCTIARRLAVAPESSATQKMQESNYVGKQFTVERRTGIMAGILKNTYLTKPQVIDAGSSENSFKVVTTLRREEGVGVGSNIYALTVNEYDKSIHKPFVFLENDVVFSGTCEHF